MSESNMSAADRAFMERLEAFRAGLEPADQARLDALIGAAGGSRDDVQGYTLFGGGNTFGGSVPFGGSTTFGSGTTFGGGNTFGSNQTMGVPNP